jgi:DNA-3-methyladenine glycosylase
MRHRRQGSRASGIADHELCRGPGNLSRALGITLAQNWLELQGDTLFLEDRGIQADTVAWSPRIGISVGTEHEWRCYSAGSRAVSGRKRVLTIDD